MIFISKKVFIKQDDLECWLDVSKKITDDFNFFMVDHFIDRLWYSKYVVVANSFDHAERIVSENKFPEEYEKIKITGILKDILPY